MKKKVFILLTFLFVCFLANAENYIEISGNKISLDDSVEEIQKRFGKEKEFSIIPFEYNSNWDTFCFKYESFIVYSARVTKMPFKIEVFDKDFEIHVDGFIVKSGSSKQVVESKLENIKYLGKDDESNEYYLYYLPDFMESGFVFDITHKLKSAYISYVPMD